MAVDIGGTRFCLSFKSGSNHIKSISGLSTAHTADALVRLPPWLADAFSPFSATEDAEKKDLAAPQGPTEQCYSASFLSCGSWSHVQPQARSKTTLN